AQGGEAAGNWWPTYGGVIEENVVEDIAFNGTNNLHAFTASNNLGGIIRNNRVERFEGAAVYLQSYWTQDLTVEGNDFRDVSSGLAVLQVIDPSKPGTGPSDFATHERLLFRDNRIRLADTTNCVSPAGVAIRYESQDAKMRLKDTVIQGNSIEVKPGYDYDRICNSEGAKVSPSGIVLDSWGTTIENLVIEDNVIETPRPHVWPTLPQDPHSYSMRIWPREQWDASGLAARVLFLRNRNRAGGLLRPLLLRSQWWTGERNAALDLPEPPPDAPSGLAALPASGSVGWSWADRSSAEPGYRVVVGLSTTLAQLPADSARWTQTGLQADRRTGPVHVVPAGGPPGARSEHRFASTFAAAPLSVTAGARTSSSIELRWSANGNPEGTVYEVFDGAAIVGRTLGESYLHKELSPGSAHSYHVRALNGARVPTAPSPSVAAATPPPAAPPPAAAPPAPYAYWPLDEGTGSVTLERSGASAAPAAASLLPGAAGPPAWREAPHPSLGKSLRFEKGSYVRVEPQRFAWPAGRPVTVSLWLRAERNAPGGFPFSVGGASGCSARFAIAVWGDGRLYWDYGDCNQPRARLSIPFQERLGAWTHVTVVSEGAGGSLKAIYLDGLLAAKAAGPSDAPSLPLSGAAIGTLGGEAFTGLVDDVRVFDRVLSPEEIRGLVAPPPPATPDVVAHHPLDQGTGVTADSGPRRWRAELQGAVAWVPGPTRALGNALSFNGADTAVQVPAFHWSAPGGPVTVSFWSKARTSQARESGLFSVGALPGLSDDTEQGKNRFQVHAPWADRVLYWDYGDINGQGRLAVPFAKHLDRWTFVTLVSEGKGGRFRAVYLDGELAASAPASDGPDRELAGLTLGAWLDKRHQGLLDDFRIYDRVLDAEAVRALHRAGRPDEDPNASEVWVSPASLGAPERGTRESPFVADTSERFDTLMRDFGDRLSDRYLSDGMDPVVIRLLPGLFRTRGQYWNGNPLHWRQLDRWTIQGAGMRETTLKLDAENLHGTADDRALHLILGRSVRGETPRAQVLRDLGLDGSFSEVAARHPAAKIRLGGAVVYGERSFAERVRLVDLGSNYTEAFGLTVSGAEHNGVPDGYVFNQGCVGAECAHISDSLFEGRVDPAARRNQLTVFIIGGSYNTPLKNAAPADPGRVDVYQDSPYLSGNQVLVDDAGQDKPGGEGNAVQGLTIYHALRGAWARDNRVLNAGVGYYSDWWSQRDILIERNRFERVAVGVSFVNDQLPGFSNEKIRVLNNAITTIPIWDGARAGVRVRRGVWGGETWAYYPPSERPRFMRDFEIRGNDISLAYAPPSPILNWGMILQEIEGLTVADNVIDSRLAGAIQAGPVYREGAEGRLVAEYANQNAVFENNRDEQSRPLRRQDAEWVGQEVPAAVAPGGRFQASITLRNSGNTTWTTSGGYGLGALQPLDNARWGVRRQALPHDVAPGQTVTFQLAATAPAQPGAYPFHWQLIQEWIEWFGESSRPVLVNVGPVQPPADTTPPATPAAPALAALSHSSLRVTWPASSDAVGVAGYRVSVARDAAFSDLVAGFGDRDVGAVLTLDVPGLAALGTYHAKVSAYDGAGNRSAWGPAASVQTPAAPDTTPPAVTLNAPSAGALLRGRVALEASAADAGRVRWVRFWVDERPVGEEDASAPYVGMWMTTSVSDGVHAVKATALDAAGNLGGSASVSVTVDNTAPGIEEVAVERALRSVVVRWRTTEPSESTLEYGRTKGLGQSAPEVAARSREHSRRLEGLEADTAYYFQLRATDAAGNAAETAIDRFSTLPDTTPPSPPGQPLLVSKEAHALEFAWNVPSDDVGVAGYEIDLSSDPAFALLLPWYRQRPSAQPRVTVTGLEAGKTYHLRVRAVDAAGNRSLVGPASSATTAPDALSEGESRHVIADPRSPASLHGAAAGVRLDLGAGSLIEPVTITMRPIEAPRAPLPEGGRLADPAGKAHEFGPSGLGFPEAASLTLPYAPGTGVAVVHYLNASGEWEPVPGSRADPATRTVSAPVRHFSVYAAIAVPEETLAGTGDIRDLFAFPNPARAATPMLRAELKTPADSVEARVYTLGGQLVAAFPLVGQVAGSGVARYEAKLGAALPSGVYWAVVTSTRQGVPASVRKTKLAILK
ncbi:MAG: fibronectin type III domain-containing protein, partial [Elusimicrobia bacterium]|nr:fibronectin type III domain-containing protein [Elusimicrobiota bacterium]